LTLIFVILSLIFCWRIILLESLITKLCHHLKTLKSLHIASGIIHLIILFLIAICFVK
jgi:hypothetical protein